MSSLQRNDLAVTYAAIDMINSLMHSMNADYDLKQEQLNKSSLISSKNFLEKLLDMWTKHVVNATDTIRWRFKKKLCNFDSLVSFPGSRQWSVGSVRNVRLPDFRSLRPIQ